MKTKHNTILFVEDNPLVLRVYRDRLEAEDFVVEAAEDGAAALEKLPQLKPSLVILDLMLPKVNGADVLKFIRAHPDLGKTPVLILSNAYADDKIPAGLPSGADKRLLKTQCTPVKLISAIRELLGIPSISENDSAPQEFSNQARMDLLRDAPAEVAKIREHCLTFVKAGNTAAGTEQLNQLYQRVRFLCSRAGLGDCTKIAHLSSALEAILFEIIFKKTMPSPSALQTIAQAVDCLGRLFQSREVESLESTLKAKVLVVDDDPVCNFVTVAAMKRARLEAVSSSDPIAALEMAQSENYDIVLLDINMPNLNGFEVCEKLRLLSGYQKTPVIFVTSNSEFQNRAQAVLSGGNDLIAKPISPLELALKTIMHLIEPQRADKTPTEFRKRAAATEVRVEKTVISEPKPVQIKIAEPIAEIKMESPAAQRNEPVKIAEPVEMKFPSVKLFTTEELPVNRISMPSNHPMPMKTENQNQPLNQLAAEVSRIIFGDENFSEMHLRLTRIALERFNVPQFIRPGANGESFDGIVNGVAKIIFGEKQISEMHLRLTRIALEHYGVPQIVSAPVVPGLENLRLNATGISAH